MSMPPRTPYPWFSYHGDQDDEWCGQCEDSETCPACGLASPHAQEYVPPQARPERPRGGFQQASRGQAAEEGST